MTPHTLTRLLAHAFRNRRKVLVKGEPGIGKSDIITQAALKAEANLVMMHPSVSDPTDFKGMPSVIKTKDMNLAEFLPFGDLRKLLEADSLTVCFIDDIGQAPHAVQAALMQLIQARCINGHELSEHVVFCGATNDSSHMAGVSSILEPVKSRWDTIIELTASIEDWKKWALTRGNMPPELIAFLDLRPDLLSAFKPSRELSNSPSPRTAAAVGKWVNEGITDIEVIAGAAGDGFAAEFIGFLRTYKSMPAIKDIITDPHNTILPDSPACSFAVCAALSFYADKKTITPFITYLSRLGSEWQTRAMRDILLKHPECSETSAFIQWASANTAAMA